MTALERSDRKAAIKNLRSRVQSRNAAERLAYLNGHAAENFNMPGIAQLIEAGAITFLAETAGEERVRSDRVRWAVELLREPSDLGGWLYVAKVFGIKAVKIGRAGNPDSRISDIQSCSPLPISLVLLVPGCGDFEIAMHDVFAPNRIARGREWFVWTPTIKQWVLEMRANQGEEALA